MNFKVLSASLLLLVACKGDGNKESEATPKGAEAEAIAPSKEESAKEKSALPTTSERIPLNTDGNSIPASIEMPTGSTIFADTPTTLRIGFDGKDDLGRRESLFAVQVQKGNEYNVNLADFASDLAKNQYGNTNEILEQSESLLLYKSTAQGGFVSHNFSLIVDLAGEQWVCKQGNDGGWSEEQVRAQLAACKTLQSL